jgi:beta-lactamase superfamily II metal-dependent hydrolase
VVAANYGKRALFFIELDCNTKVHCYISAKQISETIATILSTQSGSGLHEIDIVVATHPHSNHIGDTISDEAIAMTEHNIKAIRILILMYFNFLDLFLKLYCSQN